jgi:hypothetical protein
MGFFQHLLVWEHYSATILWTEHCIYVQKSRLCHWHRRLQPKIQPQAQQSMEYQYSKFVKSIYKTILQYFPRPWVIAPCSGIYRSINTVPNFPIAKLSACSFLPEGIARSYHKNSVGVSFMTIMHIGFQKNVGNSLIRCTCHSFSLFIVKCNKRSSPRIQMVYRVLVGIPCMQMLNTTSLHISHTERPLGIARTVAQIVHFLF